VLCFLLAGRKHCADKRNDTATGHTSPYPSGHRPKYKTRIKMRIMAMMRMMRMMMRIIIMRMMRLMRIRIRIRMRMRMRMMTTPSLPTTQHHHFFAFVLAAT
jgi:hypothetical protein